MQEEERSVYRPPGLLALLRRRDGVPLAAPYGRITATVSMAEHDPCRGPCKRAHVVWA
jgi:hypothetical protein